MKKSFLILLSFLIVSTCICKASTENNYNDLSYAIQMYKQGNFSECFVELEKFVKKRPFKCISILLSRND